MSSGLGSGVLAFFFDWLIGCFGDASVDFDDDDDEVSTSGVLAALRPLPRLLVPPRVMIANSFDFA
jgi:hypothetical protein